MTSFFCNLIFVSGFRTYFQSANCILCIFILTNTQLLRINCVWVPQKHNVYKISIIDWLDHKAFSPVRQRSKVYQTVKINGVFANYAFSFIQHYYRTINWGCVFRKLRFGRTGDEFLVLYISGQYILELQELRPCNVHEQKTNYTKEWSEKRQIYGK